MGKKFIEKVGSNTPLTVAFSVAASLIPANVAFHGMQSMGATMTSSDSLAEFTGVASAAVIAAVVSRRACMSRKQGPETPGPR